MKIAKYGLDWLIDLANAAPVAAVFRAYAKPKPHAVE
jgi:hypothetical protein